MTDIVTPTVIDDLPPAPLPGDEEPVFDSKAFSLVAALQTVVTQTNSSSADTYQNAVAAEERVIAADESAVQAAQSLAATVTARDVAIGARTGAETARDQAVTARNEAVPAATTATNAAVTATNAATTAVTARDEAEGFRDDAEVFATQQLVATSTTSLTPGAGSKNFAVQTDRAFVVGVRLTATSVSNISDYMSGVVTAYDRNTGALTLAVDDFVGVAARNDWSIGVAGKNGTGVTPTGGPTLQTLNRTGDLLTSVTFTEGGLPGTTTLTRTGDTLTQVVTVYNGKTRTETLNYSGGVLTSVTAVET